MTAATLFVLLLSADPVQAPAAAPSDAPPMDARDPLPPPFALARVDFGLQGLETDTRSARVREFRDLPTGIFVPHLRVAGRDAVHYDVFAENVLQKDARYRALVDPGPVAIEAGYTRIPHRFGNDARSLLEDTGRGVLSLGDNLQQSFQRAIEEQHARNRAGVNFAFLSALVTPSLQAEDRFDLALDREQGRVDVDLSRSLPVSLRLSYFHERRRGTRGSGTSFGFSNVVETPEPIDYRTQDLSLAAEWTRPWGLLRGALRMNWFTNTIQSQVFENPFRAVPTTDASAYQAPGSASVNGPSFGRLALPPDNEALTASGGASLRFPRSTRVSADVTWGRWSQDEPFIPFSTNTSITQPFDATDVSRLPARSLDGRIDVLTLSAAASSRPVQGLGLTARLRRYRLDNETPRIAFAEGYVRFDAAFEDIPRINVPYGHTNDRAEAAASYDLGPATIEAGWRLDRWTREFQDTHRTAENRLFVSAGARSMRWGSLTGTLERGRREFDGVYDVGEAEHATFLDPGPLTNQATLRRFNQANRDVTRAMVLAQATPVEGLTLTANYLETRDDYDESPLGLQEGNNRSFTIEGDYAASDRLGLWAFYTREDLFAFQRARQSGASPSINPADDWTSRISADGDTYGAGGRWRIRGDRLEILVRGTLQEVDGHNDLDSPPGGTPDVAVDVPEFDDTRLLTLGAELGWRFSPRWRLGVGGWHEDYELRDSNAEGVPNYAPGSFFLAPVDDDYRATVLYVRASLFW